MKMRWRIRGVLRRRRSGDRDRRARHRDVRCADLRAARGRAQPLCRRSPAHARRGVRRGARRSAGRLDRDLLGAWRVAGRGARSRATRAHHLRCHLSAGHQGAHGSAAFRARGPRRGADRPRRASGGRGHDWSLRPRIRRTHPAGRIGRGRAAPRGARPPQAGLRHPDDAVGRRHRRHRVGPARALPRRWPRRARKTSATRRRTARMRSRSMLASPTCWSSSGRRRVRIRTAWSSSASAPASRPIWSMAPRTCAGSGSKGRRCVGITAGASAPEVLVKQVVARLVEWGAESPQELPGKAEQWCSGCRARCASADRQRASASRASIPLRRHRAALRAVHRSGRPWKLAQRESSDCEAPAFAVAVTRKLAPPSVIVSARA